MTLIEDLRRLLGEAEAYRGLLTLPAEARIGVRLTDSGDEATLIFAEKGVKVAEDLKEPDILLTMESHILRCILDGEGDFAALIARSRVSEERPIGIEILNPENRHALEALRMTILLFIPGRIKVKRLRAELAGEAHGGHPIPLLYWNGVRIAWYHLNRGEILNPEGERDSYPQLIVILRGRGWLRLDEGELTIESGLAIYIPPNSLHQLKAESDVELLWIAWRAM